MTHDTFAPVSSSLQTRFDSPLRASPQALRHAIGSPLSTAPREANAMRVVDEAWFSDDALAFARAAEDRGERIHRIRGEIAAGTYDTPDRGDAGLDKLIAAALELD